MEMHQGPGSSTDPVPYAASGLPGQSPCLVDMLHRINELDAIPQLQVAQRGATSSRTDGVVSNTSVTYLPLENEAISQAHPQCTAHQAPQSQTPNMHTDTDQPGKLFPKVGRPRTRPQRERNEWHYHLGGVRHCRVPLSAELKEVLEVAYVSRIMSKNFRKEGQPEKERIAKITGMDIDKVQEWFKNRRKKDRLQQDRAMGRNLPKCHRSRRSTTSDNSASEPQKKDSVSSSNKLHIREESVVNAPVLSFQTDHI